MQLGQEHYVSVMSVRLSVRALRILLTRYLEKNVGRIFAKITTLMHFGTEINATDFVIKKSKSQLGYRGIKYAGKSTLL